MKTPDGKVVGEHVGLSFYTLGQRKGIGVGGLKAYKNADGSSDAWYVARKDVANNTLYIVQGHDHPWLLSSSLRADQASWIAGVAPEARALSAKTRYRQADVACEIAPEGESDFALKFMDAQWAVTPGQSAVLYDGEVCLGGGIIDSSTFAGRAAGAGFAALSGRRRLRRPPLALASRALALDHRDHHIAYGIEHRIGLERLDDEAAHAHRVRRLDGGRIEFAGHHEDQRLGPVGADLAHLVRARFHLLLGDADNAAGA
jgi:hypothetical protein